MSKKLYIISCLKKTTTEGASQHDGMGKPRTHQIYSYIQNNSLRKRRENQLNSFSTTMDKKTTLRQVKQAEMQYGQKPHPCWDDPQQE